MGDRRPGWRRNRCCSGILSGVAGGIQTSRLSASADTTKSNLVARLAELYDGTQIGDPGLLNDDIFGVLALYQAGAPPEILRQLVESLRIAQKSDRGLELERVSLRPLGHRHDRLRRGRLLRGVEPSDPDLAQALALLHDLQGSGQRRLHRAAGVLGVGLNTDTTAWVASGLVQCGIDPQGPEWTTSENKTPLDYLVSMQHRRRPLRLDRRIRRRCLRDLQLGAPAGGRGLLERAARAPRRGEPAVHAAPAVADGTTVPITLVIDHGPGADDVRMCRVDTGNGLKRRRGGPQGRPGQFDPGGLRHRVRREWSRARLTQRRHGDVRLRLDGEDRRDAEPGPPGRLRRPCLRQVRGDSRRPGGGAKGRGSAAEGR